MSIKKLFKLTQSGQDEIKKELDGLLDMRVAIAERIKQARSLGDLSENAEYQSAREEQDRLETRISELEHILQNAKLIKKPKANGEVKLGSNVKLKSAEGQAKEFQVVGTMEADPSSGKISDESPIGKVLIGKKVGDKVTIAASESSTYKITSIN